MLRFRLFGYPVRIEWMFWVVCAILGMDLMQVPGPQGLGMMVLWVVIVLGSVLWHELGHAFARKKFGEPYSEISLHGFGGICSGPGRFTRHEQMAVSAAGPVASLLLGGMVWMIAQTPGAQASFWMHFFVGQMLWVNIGWAILNLLPIFPLDGGRIFEAFMANRKPSLVPKVGMLTAAVIAVFGLVGLGSIWMALLFGYLAYANWQRTNRVQPRF